MNWAKAKTILIILFIATDLFLLATLISSQSPKTVSDEIIDAAVSVLNTNDITIDKEIIPKKYKAMPYKEADNVITGYDDFAKKILGDDFTKNVDGTYSSQNGILSFWGNRFSYKYTGAYPEILLDPTNATSMLFEFMDNLGFDISNAKFDVIEDGGIYTIECNNHSDKLPIYNSKAVAKIHGDSITEFSGTWFNVTDARGTQTDIKAVSTALVDFVSLNLQKPLEISKIELVYDIPIESSYHKSVTLIPSWCITLTDGTNHLIDARNPE